LKLRRVKKHIAVQGFTTATDKSAKCAVFRVARVALVASAIPPINPGVPEFSRPSPLLAQRHQFRRLFRSCCSKMRDAPFDVFTKDVLHLPLQNFPAPNLLG